MNFFTEIVRERALAMERALARGRRQRKLKGNDCLDIQNVIVNDKALIVLFSDGTKSVQMPKGGDKMNIEYGILMACARRLLGNKTSKGGHYSTIKYWVEKCKPVKKIRKPQVKKAEVKKAESYIMEDLVVVDYPQDSLSNQE